MWASPTNMVQSNNKKTLQEITNHTAGRKGLTFEVMYTSFLI